MYGGACDVLEAVSRGRWAIDTSVRRERREGGSIQTSPGSIVPHRKSRNGEGRVTKELAAPLSLSLQLTGSMIYVDGRSFITSASSSSQGSEILASLLEHPTLVSASSRLKATPERKVPAAELSPTAANHVYVFQREYATVDPALVEMIGTDEATTCVGLVIHNRESRMTSVGHLDFVGVVDTGLTQMLSLVVDHEANATLDVHLIGSFEDAPYEHISDTTESESHEYQVSYSWPLCAKIIEALQNRSETFHLQTLCVLGHNTKRDSYGNPCPIISGFMVDTSSGSIMPANFHRRSRCPDEVVRRIRVTVSSEDPTCMGKLLETYDTCHDRFQIAPCSWMSDWEQIALSLQQLSDSEILFRCSTSPFAEGPDFVENERRIWSYLTKYPDWRRTFPGRKPHIFERTAEGGWLRCG